MLTQIWLISGMLTMAPMGLAPSLPSLPYWKWGCGDQLLEHLPKIISSLPVQRTTALLDLMLRLWITPLSHLNLVLKFSVVGRKEEATAHLARMCISMGQNRHLLGSSMMGIIPLQEGQALNPISLKTAIASG